ncbi:MAG: DUF2905 domain-containing protein [Thermogutta sp.]
MELSSLGKILVIVGLLITAIGGLLWASRTLPLNLGQLPGDIHVRGNHWSFFFPLTTCIVISIILTIVVNIMIRFLR